jgi:hypothetical protein
MTGCCASSDLKSDNNENDLKRNKIRLVLSVFIFIQKPDIFNDNVIEIGFVLLRTIISGLPNEIYTYDSCFLK